MNARMLSTLGRRAGPFATLVIVLVGSGCSAMARKHEANRIPQYGVIDPHQPRELQKVAVPALYHRAAGRAGDRDPAAAARRRPVDVRRPGRRLRRPGLRGRCLRRRTDADRSRGADRAAPDRAAEGEQRPMPSQTYEVSVRLATNQSKFYYVLGAVGNQGRFKSTGNETVLDAILQAGLSRTACPTRPMSSSPSRRRPGHHLRSTGSASGIGATR